LDTDVALGAPRGDVDDGFAVAALVRAVQTGRSVPLGVSAVTGNTDGRTAFACLGRLLRALQADLPAVSEDEAPAALTRLPEGSSVVAIGPPSNLTRAAILDPAFPGRVDVRVVGRVTSRLRHPLLALFDLNFRSDPAASRAFWRLPWREVRVFPLDVVVRMRFDADDLDRLVGSGEGGAYLARHSRRWLRRARTVHLRRSFPVWDLPAALDAVGHLAGAEWTAGPRSLLRAFDVRAAREAFFSLLEA
jgi:inosine-uridine nucleoside N-ribohydrolase